MSSAVSGPHGRDLLLALRSRSSVLRTAQTFEDLGVKAHKRGGNLMGNDLILTTALRIHSIEARHAAEARRVRGMRAWDGGAFDPAFSKARVLAMVGPLIGGLKTRTRPAGQILRFRGLQGKHRRADAAEVTQG